MNKEEAQAYVENAMRELDKGVTLEIPVIDGTVQLRKTRGKYAVRNDQDYRTVGLERENMEEFLTVLYGGKSNETNNGK